MKSGTFLPVLLGILCIVCSGVSQTSESLKDGLVLDKVYEAEEMNLGGGTIVWDGDAFNLKAVKVASGQIPTHGHIVFGPYTDEQSSGNYRVFFRLKIDDNTKDTPAVEVDCFHSAAGMENENRVINADEFENPGEYQYFHLDFKRSDKGLMQYRVRRLDRSITLSIDRISVFEKQTGGSDGKTELDLPLVDKHLEVTNYPFFVSSAEGKEDCREVSIVAYSRSPLEDAGIKFEFNDKEMFFPIGGMNADAPDPVQKSLWIEPFKDGVAKGKASLVCNEGVVCSEDIEIDFGNRRNWKIYLVPDAHLDIGYTHFSQRETIEVHNENLTDALRYCEKYPDFGWEPESSFTVQNWLETAAEEQKEKLWRLCRSKRIGVGASYANMLSGLMSDEEMFRNLYYSYSLSREYGVPFKSVVQTDIPSRVWTYPMVLANCGIKFLAQGLNPFGGEAVLSGSAEEGVPGIWKGPDGSEVVTVFTDHYAYARKLGLTGEKGIDVVKDKIDSYLEKFKSSNNYPYNIVYAHGAKMDNNRLRETLASAVHKWNNTYRYPKIVMGPSYLFYEELKERYSNKLEDGLDVYNGTFGSYWEDGAASSARETTINRQNQRDIILAEMLWTVQLASGTIDNYPKERFDKAWDNIMLYDEHTWGASNSIEDPKAERVVRQWEIKSEFAEKAQKQVKNLLDTAVSRESLSKKPNRQAPKVEDNIIESEYYRIEINERTGCLSSIFDKKQQRELVDDRAEYRFGEVVYQEGANEYMIHHRGNTSYPELSHTPPTVKRVEEIDKGLKVVMEHEMFPEIILTVTAGDSERQIDFVYEMEKKKIYEKEGLHIAFPFSANKPVIDYSVGNGVVRAGRDWVSGACLDWFSVREWVKIKDDNFNIVWTTPDAPLIELQDINARKWLKELPITNGHIYSFLMNNYWFTNYKAGQGGSFKFRFSLTSGNNLTFADAEKFSCLWSESAKDILEDALQVDSENVIIQCFKPAEYGEGFIIRLREMNGESTDVGLRAPVFSDGIDKAWLCNGVEEKKRLLQVQEGNIEVPVKAYGISTVRVLPAVK